MSIILRLVSAASCPHIVCPTTSTTSIDRHECFSVFHHMQKDKQSKQHHSLKLGKEKRESSKGNYYIISPRVIIKAIIIVVPADCTTMILPPDARSLSTASCITSGHRIPVHGHPRQATNNIMSRHRIVSHGKQALPSAGLTAHASWFQIQLCNPRRCRSAWIWEI